MAPAERDAWLALIETGPPGLDSGHHPNDAASYAVWWRQQRLTVVLRDVPPEWYDAHAEWLAGVAEATDFQPYFTEMGTAGASPLAAAGLEALSFDQLVAYLAGWQPPGTLLGPSEDGLGQMLRKVVADDPERFAWLADRFTGLKPPYLRGLLSGFQDAAAAGRTFPWAALLALGRWIAAQPPEETNPWPKRSMAEMAELLSLGLRPGLVSFPPILRDEVWATLQALVEHLGPVQVKGGTPEERAEDAAFRAANSMLGQTVHALISFAMWVRRTEPPAAPGVALANSPVTVGEAPPLAPVGQECLSVLDRLLDLARPIPAAMVVRAVCGERLHNLFYAAPTWLRERRPLLFPRDEPLDELRDACWHAYITRCPIVERSLVELLVDEYDHAIAAVGIDASGEWRRSDPDRRLAEHLMVMYWRGDLALDGASPPAAALQRLFDRAPAALRQHALWFVGRALAAADAPLSDDLAARVRALWAWRLAAALASGDAGELAAFGWWFVAGKLDDLWALAQLGQVLRMARRVDVPHQVVERLAKLANTAPAQAVDCLALPFDGNDEDWRMVSWENHARTVLAAALTSGDSAAHQTATALINRLAARNQLGFRDLLET